MSRLDDVRAARRAGDAWADAVWESSLKPLERLVALAYADHVSDDPASVWVHGARLRERTGLSRDSTTRALRGLADAGWLTVTSAAAQHHSTRYALTLPAEASERSASQNADQRSASRNAEASGTPGGTLAGLSVPSPRASVPPPRASVPPPGTDPSTYPSSYPPVRAAEESSAPAPLAGSGDGSRDDPRRVEAERAARAAGVDEDVLAPFVERVLADASTEHSIGGRIARDHGWRERHLGAVRGQHADARRADDVADQARAIFAQVEAAGEAGRRAIATARAAMGAREAERRPLLHARNAARELRDHLDTASPDAPAVSA